MTKFSGSFLGKSTWQTSVSLKDQPAHDIMLGEISGPQNTADANWKDAVVTYWNTIDMVAGNGVQRGYYVNVRPNGDTDRGSFEGKVSFSSGEGRVEGTWKASGGTGKFSAIKASGNYHGRMLSPTEVQMTWDGDYQLG